MSNLEQHSLTWASACVQLGHLFSRDACDSPLAYWPERMTPGQAAALQRPWHPSDRQARAHAQALERTMRLAIQAGTLAAETETEKQKARPAEAFAPTRQRRADGSRVYVSRPARPERIVSTDWLRPPSLVAWLTAVGEAPSEHVNAWQRASIGLLVFLGDARRTAPGRPDPDVLKRDAQWLRIYSESLERQARCGLRPSKAEAYREVCRASGLDPASKTALERIRKGVARALKLAPGGPVIVPATLTPRTWASGLVREPLIRQR